MKQWAGFIGILLAFSIIGCNGNDDEEIIVVSGRLLKNEASAWENLDLELVDIAQSGANPENTTSKVIELTTTDEKGKFRFEYIKNLDTRGGSSCTESEEGLLLKVASTGKIIFKCYPKNKDVSNIFYTSTDCLLRIEMADTLAAGDTIFFPYAPADTEDPNYIELTDSSGNVFPYFYFIGPSNPRAFVLNTNFYTAEYAGFDGVKRGEELYQWFIKGDTSYHFGLETWRPRGLPYRDTITVSGLYR